MPMSVWKLPIMTLGLTAVLALAGCGQPTSLPVVTPEGPETTAIASSGESFSVQQRFSSRRIRCSRMLNYCLRSAFVYTGYFRFQVQRRCYQQYRHCLRYR